MPKEKIRWGVLSTANIGRVAVIPAIQASHNGELVAVASRDPDKAKQFASRLGIGRAYGSYAALLEAGDIDAVYIPLPNSLHREWTIRAAQAGKHILCEKPLPWAAGGCLERAAAARQHGVPLDPGRRQPRPSLGLSATRRTNSAAPIGRPHQPLLNRPGQPGVLSLYSHRSRMTHAGQSGLRALQT